MLILLMICSIIFGHPCPLSVVVPLLLAMHMQSCLDNAGSCQHLQRNHLGDVLHCIAFVFCLRCRLLAQGMLVRCFQQDTESGCCAGTSGRLDPKRLWLPILLAVIALAVGVSHARLADFAALLSFGALIHAALVTQWSKQVSRKVAPRPWVPEWFSWLL